MKFILIQISLVLLIVSCEGSNSGNEKNLEIKTENLEDAHQLELELFEQLDKETVHIDSLEILKSKGVDLNIVLETNYEHDYNFKLFRKNKTWTEIILFNPLHAALERDEITNKMETVVWLLENGADPNIRAEKDKLPIESFMLYANMLGSRSRMYSIDEDDEFTMNYIDTLISYGADLSIVNMSYAEGNIDLISALLVGGADPINMDINEFFKYIKMFHSDEQVAQVLSYPLPYDSLTSCDRVMWTDLDYLELCLKNGLNPNMSYDGEFLLAKLIEAKDVKRVKLMRSYGATRVDQENTGLLEFADQKGIKDKRILALLEDESEN